MLARKYRLSKQKEIEQVLKKGKIFYSPFFNLKVLKNNLTHPRFCIIISTKISKKATVRNKTKRQIRAIIYKNLPNINKSYDIVVLTKPAATISQFKNLEKGLVPLLK